MIYENFLWSEKGDHNEGILLVLIGTYCTPLWCFTHLQDTPADALIQGTPVVDITSLQAENGRLHNLSTEAMHSGYHGSGYIAGWNHDGQWVDLFANITNAGSYHIILRFATGAGVASRYLYVNGNGVVNNVLFPSTGSWNSYSTVTINNVSLHAGNNTISLIYNRSLGSRSYLNLDEVTVVG